MNRPILNIADVDLQPWGHGAPSMPGAGTPDPRYQGRIGAIAPRLGAKKLGYNITVLPPGKSAFPLHAHTVNEEMFFVVEGEGEVRIGSERHAIRTGDVIACPPGGPETAHQIVNTGARELKVLGVSTRMWPEVAQYPETGRFGVLAELPGEDGKPRMMRFMGTEGATLEYWQGE
jgi:uncharacterized cupin superfamily protein